MSPVVSGRPVPIGLLYSDLSNNNRASLLKYMGEENISFRKHVFDILDNVYIVNPLLPRGQWFQEEKWAFTGNDNFRTLIMCHSVEDNKWHQPARQLIVGKLFFLPLIVNSVNSQNLINLINSSSSTVHSCWNIVFLQDVVIQPIWKGTTASVFLTLKEASQWAV